MESMTGYGDSAFSVDGIRFTIEVRSVNSRFLEPVYNFPAEFSWFEPLADLLLKKKIQRGHIEVRITPDGSLPKTAVMNQMIVSQYRELYQSLTGKDNIPFKILSQLPGVFDLKVKDWRALESKLEFYYLRALLKMQRSRLAEGRRIFHWIKTRLRYLNRLNNKIESDFKASRKKIMKSLKLKMLAMLDVQEDGAASRQLVQLARKIWNQNREEILQVMKNDIEEEIQRNKIHLQSMLNLMKEKKAIGKQLEFYLQEILREVNTLASKTPDTEINKTAIMMKIEIEKIREQARNLE